MSATSLRIEDIESRVGQELAVSPWYEVPQERIDRFAEATEDRQWIHVDPERARSSPFGSTIAHGFLTLSLLPKLAEGALALSNRRMGVNYGLDRVRFTAPVPAGSRVRARFTPTRCEKLDGGGLQVTWNVVVERESLGQALPRRGLARPLLRLTRSRSAVDGERPQDRDCSRSWSARQLTLPVALFGSESTNSTMRGYL